jgi:quercetin dioxygenase-like cupin family protein
MQDGIFIKQMVLIHPGLEVAQHTHKYDHSTLLTLGQVRIWRDGELWGDFMAPHVLTIKAGVAHRFLSLSSAVLYCIHNVMRSGEVEILAEAMEN